MTRYSFLQKMIENRIMLIQSTNSIKTEGLIKETLL